MRTIIFVLLCVLAFTSSQFSQTQLLKVGNAVQYSYESNTEWIVLTTRGIEINGKEYFERKVYTPWIIPSADQTTYERIEGDSAYYVLDLTNQDSLLFNFNWQTGKKFLRTKLGFVYSGQRIDSISIRDTFLPDDTVYVLRNFSYNMSTGDTNYNVIPEYNYLSKKCGRLNDGMWIYSTGVRIDGIRYGSLYPYPEEVVFSEDSIYIPTLGDTGSVKIVNTSDHSVRIDSINSVGAFYGYRGFLSKPGFEYQFYLVQTLPSPQWNDSLGIVIPPHDSINVSFYDVDLCPICDYEVQEYFKDTLRFVFTFLDGNVYAFSKTIPISGEGHPSDVTDNEVLPNEFVLEQNYPNPFNPSTTIKYSIPNVTLSGALPTGRQVEGSRVQLKVYDVLGNEVATLVNEDKPAGSYEVEFKPSVGSHQLASGIYYYQLRAGEFVETKKMMLVK